MFGRISELQPRGTSPLDELLSLSAAELRRISKSNAEKAFIILISFAQPSKYDIFGALKEDHSKPKFITPVETGTVNNSNLGTSNASLGSLFDQMTAL